MSDSQKASLLKLAPAAVLDACPEDDEGDRLILELGQATAIIDLLFMVATDSDVESLNEDTLSDSLHTALMRLEAAKEAAAALISYVASGGGASTPKGSAATEAAAA